MSIPRRGGLDSAGVPEPPDLFSRVRAAADAPAARLREFFTPVPPPDGADPVPQPRHNTAVEDAGAPPPID
jgi:hypothetical protein